MAMDFSKTQIEPPPLNVAIVADMTRLKPGWIIGFGILLGLLGAFALSSVVTATIVSVYFVAAVMVFAGAAQMAIAFQSKSSWTVTAWFLMGTFYSAAGFLAFFNPLLAASGLTFFLGASLIASGIIRLVLAFQMRPGSTWILIALSAAITTLLGFSVLSQWPLSSLYILGLFLSIDLLLAGLAWIVFGAGLLSHQAPATSAIVP
ncbi:MAG: HdeD family acid-resistance protein [Beijerinckiaceae bacterium]